MKRKLKRILAWVLLCSMLFSGSFNENIVLAAETDNIVNGQCGENVYYELNVVSGVLRIFGYGRMADYGSYTDKNYRYAPWIEEYASVITEVNIEYGVTSIGKRAFLGSSVTPSLNCENLKIVDIAESVTEIGSGAFGRCKGLTEIAIPNSVKNIGNEAFSGASLLNVEWGNSIQMIGNGAFSETQLTELKLPPLVQNIGPKAFENCKNLKYAEIPDNCELGYEAFSYCDALTSIVLGKGCQIHGGVFNECFSLNSVLLGEGSICVRGNARDVDRGIFRNCVSLQSIVLPDSWEFYDGADNTWAYFGQFDGCNNLADIQFTSSNNKYETINNVVYSNDGKKIIYYPLGLVATEYEIPDGVTEIGYGAFLAQNHLENVTIPSSIHEIGGWAFSQCSKLNNIIIPEGVKELKGGTFSWCAELKSIVWPASLEKIDLNYKGGSHSFWRTNLDVIYGEAGSYAEEWAGTKFQNTIYCFFDANGGVIERDRKAVIYNDTYHKLPQPMRRGYQFLGWYTKKNSGNLVSDDTVVLEKSSHRLYAHWQTEVPVKKQIDKTTITLERDSYIYDGMEKKPSVSIRDGSVVLFDEVDYTVSYIDNINVGTAKVVITGIGNYSGTIYKAFTIIEKRQGFVWNRNNWNFNNSSYQGYFSSGKYTEQINSLYMDKLKSSLTNSEYKVIFNERTGWLHENFGGSCYGMASTNFLAVENLLPYSDYSAGAISLYELSYPLVDDNVSSLITYYQMLQVKDVIQQQYRKVPNKTHKENIRNIISLLDKSDTVLIGFKKIGWGGHAVLAYGYEYGNYKWKGKSYQGCIKICDPNSSKEYNKECNIYYNTNTYEWIIPYYSNASIDSTSGAKFNYIGADINEINYGGYLLGTANVGISDFVARIDATEVSQRRTVTKVSEVSGNYITQNGASNDIVEDYSYILGGASEGTIGYNLYDAESAYKLSQDSTEKLQLSMDYEDCYLEGGSDAGNYVIFDKDGYVSVSGESADYNISMTFDKNYPTDWSTIQVNGKDSKEASLEKSDQGYILSGDNLEDTEVCFSSKNDSIHISFNTEYQSAYIYETNEDTIGVKVDMDDNGTYETVLDVQNLEKLPEDHVHNYDSTWNSDSSGHWKKCVCGKKSEVFLHTFVWITDRQATSTETGLKHEECSICRYIRNRDTLIEKLVPTDSNMSTDSTIFENSKKQFEIGKVKKISFRYLQKGTIILKWGKVKKAKGYQVQYSLKKNFLKKKMRKTKFNQVVLKGLKPKRKYYVRIRAYEKKGKRRYGKWSKVRMVRGK